MMGIYIFVLQLYLSCVLYRWDLQRIREQKIYEKLKDKERGEASTAKDEPNQPSLQSFYPTLDSSEFNL